jgi:hypothetical protein
MKKLIEDLIDKFEEKSKTIESNIAEKTDNNQNITMFLYGEVLSLQSCIQDLKRLLKYQSDMSNHLKHEENSNKTFR